MIIKKCDICGAVVDELYEMDVHYRPEGEEYKYLMLPMVDYDYICKDCVSSVLRMKKKWKERGYIEKE